MGGEDMKPWIGVDLDGTLATYDGTTNGIGPIVKPMLAKVKTILNNGVYDVRILTARAGVPELIPEVKQWLLDNGLPDLAITDKKDFAMVACYDDRAITIVPNTGLTVDEYRSELSNDDS